MNKQKDYKYLFLFFTTIGVMLICTKSSPLYPFNDWVDSNIYFTIGKAIIHEGKIPYRDIFDHKGPLVYFVYGLASLISEKTFLGVWFLEIIAAYLFLIYSYKTLCLFCDKKAVVLMPIFAGIVYSSNHMRHGGSVEELCLPILAYALYLSAKYLIKKEMFQNKELFWIGVTSAAVLWIKYTMLGFYIGWILVPAAYMIRKKQWKNVFKTILMITAGVMTMSVPILIYFLLNNALADLFTVYFYNNIFVYAGKSVAVSELLFRTFRNIISVSGHNFMIFGLIIIGVTWLAAKKYIKIFAHIVMCGVFMILTVLTAETVHGYYSMCFSVFGILGIIVLWNIVDSMILKHMRYNGSNNFEDIKIAVVSFVGMFSLVYIMGYNTYLLSYERNELPQYQFAEIIEKNETPTLLNYGFLDGGFYTAAGIIPSNKYFFKANINLQEMKDEQDFIVEQGLVEYVVTQDEQYNWPLYREIAESDFIYEGQKVTYYLYQMRH